MIKKIIFLTIIYLEFCFRLFMGKILGISYIVGYLRNPNPEITVKILRAFGAKIGEGTTIKRSIFLDNVYGDENSIGDLSYLKIGDNCYIGDCTFFDLADEVILEDNVVISGGVSFLTHSDCNRSKYLEKFFPRECKKIIIKEGAWVAYNATILNGVTVGKNSVVAAHSLVKEDVEEYSLYAGIPSKKIKEIK